MTWIHLLIFAAAPLTAATFASTYSNSIGMEFVLVPPGEMRVAVFQPVCPTAEDPGLDWTPADLARCRELAQKDGSAGFPVTIAKPFYLGKYEVTQAEWRKVMGTNPSAFQSGEAAAAERHPVESVTWNDCQRFLKRLNRREHTRLYRLPTEFEWEYAGRANGPGQIGWDDIREQAVQGLRANAEGPPTTHVVGSKRPNAWGLYDMLGNVWEWVRDDYNEKTFPDPVPPKHGTQHVLKGAGFASDVKNAIYSTHAAGPGDGWDVGFRVVKDAQP